MAPHATFPNLFRRLLALVALASVVACVPGPTGGSGAGALPAVVAMLDFAAYPQARLISQEAYSENIGYIDRPGRSATRVYETPDDRRTIRAHYERLAQAEGWNLAPLPPGLALDDRHNYEIARLTKGPYQVQVTVEAHDGVSYGDPGFSEPGYGEPGASPPTPAPSAAPSAAPPGPSRIRIYAYLN